MHEDGKAVPDTVTLLSLLQVWIHAKCAADGMLIECLKGAVKKICGDLECWVFPTGNSRNRAWARKPFMLQYYSAMQEDGMAVPSAGTFMSLLEACASLGQPLQGWRRGSRLISKSDSKDFKACASIARPALEDGDIILTCASNTLNNMNYIINLVLSAIGSNIYT